MITAIGNPVYDLIKTPVLDPGERLLSGCSTNAALALARMGAKVRLIGSIGNDYRSHLQAYLQSLDIEQTLIESEQSGGFSLHYYDDYGNRTLDLLGRATDIKPLEPMQYRDSQAVLVGPILREVSHQAIRQIRDNFEGLLFCDPQGLLRGATESGGIYHEKPDGIEEILGLFDIVKPNELEGKVLTGIDCREDPYSAAKVIHGWGPRIVIVTLAELGSVIYDGNQFIDIPPHPVKLLDSTGAGDTYMAGFTFEYLASGGDLRKSGCYASCTSSIMIEHSGPDFNMTEEAIRSRQETLLAMDGFKVDVAVNR